MYICVYIYVRFCLLHSMLHYNLYYYMLAENFTTYV